MSRWPGVGDLMRAAHPAQRAEIARAAAAMGQRVLPASAPARPPAAGPVMNKTELRYSQRLRAEGLQPRFAALTLLIASPVKWRRYTPDFLVERDGQLELHEVKGAYVYPDAEIKFEAAVEQWNTVYAFVWARWAGGTWSIRRYERQHAGA